MKYVPQTIVFVILWGCSCLSSGNDSGNSTISKTDFSNGKILVNSSSSTGAKMLVMDTNEPYHYSSDIQEYDNLIYDLTRYCGDSKSKIGDMITACQQSLKSIYSKERSLKWLLEFAESMMSSSGTKFDSCAEAFALMVVTIGVEN